MPANTAPIYPLTPNFAQKTLTAADTTKDGTTLAAVWTAGANGARIDRIVAKPLGTNTASVLRVFLNNGGAIGTAANNSMVKDAGLVATTNTEVDGNEEVVIPMDMVVPAGWKILLSLGTTVAAGWAVTVIAADF